MSKKYKKNLHLITAYTIWFIHNSHTVHVLLLCISKHCMYCMYLQVIYKSVARHKHGCRLSVLL